jgi:hypothetical protein
MKRILPLFLVCLLAGCSKDDDNAARPNGNGTTPEPELKIWVYSNHKFPNLQFFENTTLAADINNNDDFVDEMPVLYSRQSIADGPYIFYGKAWNHSSQNDTLMLNTDSLWVRLVVILKGDTIADSTRTAPDFNPQSVFIGIQDTVQ